jgi:hypothetical protein
MGKGFYPHITKTLTGKALQRISINFKAKIQNIKSPQILIACGLQPFTTKKIINKKFCCN